MRVIKSSKIWGIEQAEGTEWDAGYVPYGVAGRCAKVIVRKNASWTVYCLGRRGGETLSCHTLMTFSCETCAKAFALCLVHGFDHASCNEHGRNGFSESDLFDAFVKVLLSAMGIDENMWTSLDDGAKHRLMWVAREIVDEKKNFAKVVAIWDYTQKENRSLRGAILDWFREINR